MATSKLPIEYAPVPDWAITLGASGTITCNLRPNQRSRRLTEDDVDWSYGQALSDEIFAFLKNLKGGETILILFQGYVAEKIGTAVVKVTGVYWTRDDLARLDFERPEGMDEVNGCPNFWTSMLLAAMRVPDGTPTSAKKGDEHFKVLVADSLKE